MNTEMESKSLVLYDRDIREPLFDYLEERFGRPGCLKKIIGRSGQISSCWRTSMIGLEIKSDADTYERWSGRYVWLQQVLWRQLCRRKITWKITWWRNIIPSWWNYCGGKQREKRWLLMRKSGVRKPKMKRNFKLLFCMRPELQKFCSIICQPINRRVKFVHQNWWKNWIGTDWNTRCAKSCLSGITLYGMKNWKKVPWNGETAWEIIARRTWQQEA